LKRFAWKDEVTPNAEKSSAGVEGKPLFSGENPGKQREFLGKPKGKPVFSGENTGEPGETEGETCALLGVLRMPSKQSGIPALNRREMPPGENQTRILRGSRLLPEILFRPLFCLVWLPWS